MERRDFLKTMGVGAASMAVGGNLLASHSGGTGTAIEAEALPSIGLISGSGGNWHRDGSRAGLKKIAEWGYTEMEFGGGIRGMEADEWPSYLQSLGLKPMIGSAGMAVLLDEEKLKTTIETSLKQGKEYLACYWPWLDENKQDSIDGWKEVADHLNIGGAVCKREGITLIFHNHDMEFYPVEGQIPFDVMMSNLDPAVGIELDLYWIYKSGVSVEEYLQKYPGRYPVLHVKDIPADIKLGTGRTVFGDLTENDFTCVGCGSIDFASIFKLNSISGAKHFMVEADKPGNVATFLELSAKYLRELRF